MHLCPAFRPIGGGWRAFLVSAYSQLSSAQKKKKTPVKEACFREAFSATLPATEMIAISCKLLLLPPQGLSHWPGTASVPFMAFVNQLLSFHMAAQLSPPQRSLL